MVQFDYDLVSKANRAYAVQGSSGVLDELFRFLKSEEFGEMYDAAEISEKHRNLSYGTVREFDLKHKSEAEQCIEFLGGNYGFEDNVLVRIQNADEAPNSLREKLEHRIKSFHEKNSYDPNTPNTCVLVSGTDSLSKYDFTLSGRIFSPPALQ